MFFWRHYGLVIPLLCFATHTAVAAIHSSFYHHSRCALSESEANQPKWPKLCYSFQSELTRSLQLPAAKASAGSQEQSTSTYSELYLGGYASSLLSLHLTGSYQTEKFAQSSQQDAVLRHAYIHLGHPLFSEVSAAIGKLETPFGLQLRASSERLKAYQLNLWPEPNWGYILRYLPSQELRVEFGQSYTETLSEPMPNDARPRSRSLRISRSLTALEGTMILLSARDQVNDQKLLSAAITNQSNGRASSLEWVRRLNPNGFGQSRFEQLFRFNYFSVIKERNRWFLEYEIARKDYWLLNYGIEYFFWLQRFRLVGELAYRRDPHADVDDKLIFQLSARFRPF